MTDPRDTTQRHDSGGIVDTGAHAEEPHNAADDMETAEKDAAEEAASHDDDPNDLEADNSVEADSIETLDPDNPPA
ncbi:hypothetical protein DCE93_03055 [Agromyces badenianii]|uniref:Uncharacterized protein n=1 Tax=Agromyces badenianii TaxID=2080742 RepID=A0A2S0WTZ1_9MICO|nr:hypothetical protein [Agromyces badenianii]AWB94760.1 hypothetical protein DCE93_03055 [Agromyces badenianii]